MTIVEWCDSNKLAYQFARRDARRANLQFRAHRVHPIDDIQDSYFLACQYASRCILSARKRVGDYLVFVTPANHQFRVRHAANEVQISAPLWWMGDCKQERKVS
jgi:hypothetical protein